MADTGDSLVCTLLPPFIPVGGRLWTAPLPTELHDMTDTNMKPFGSPLRLLEDGCSLGPGHVIHDEIAQHGRGRYSFWTTVLYFSSSDDSDPNSNGRAYAVVVRHNETERAILASSTEADGVDPVWEKPDRPLRCTVVGMGSRGLHLARLAQSFPGAEIAWVVDQVEPRATQALALVGASGTRATTSLAEAIEDPAVDIVFVTVPDYLHRAVAEPAFHAGKDVYLEKPIATTVADARAILTSWQQSGRILQLGYVLRQASFYRAVRSACRSGILGPVRLVTLHDQLDVALGASYMRRWHRSSARSGGLMVHKGCHDLDLICWLLGTRPRLVSSFGGLDIFVGPPPALFCSQCDRRSDCAYVDRGLYESRTPAEWANPTVHALDRCVFRTDKDIIDNQVVAFELASGARGTFSLSMQNPVRSERRIALVGDAARLDGVFEDGQFSITFADSQRQPIVWSADGADAGSHGGGDLRTMHQLLTACANRTSTPIGTPEEVIAGLIFATAAEEARTMGTVVPLHDADFQVVA